MAEWYTRYLEVVVPVMGVEVQVLSCAPIIYLAQDFMNSDNPDIRNLLEILEDRFEQNMHRHKNLKWSQVLERLNKNPKKLRSLNEMEKTGGEPDVVALYPDSENITFVDCSAQSPKGRRSLCYDQIALKSRKEFKPKNSALGLAEEMGVKLLDEDQYRQLQEFGKFDTKTSSWIKTPSKIRNLGGAIFGDRRYNTVFTYHNGAESYYASRGFRAILKI